MRRANSARAVALSLVGLACCISPALPCTCLGPIDFEDAVAHSGMIFRGTVLDVTSAGPQYPGEVIVTVHVAKCWKGACGKTIQIMTPESSAACGFTFEVGSDYVIYTATSSPHGYWNYVYLCSRTHASWPADPDIAALDAWQVTPVVPMSWGEINGTANDVTSRGHELRIRMTQLMQTQDEISICIRRSRSRKMSRHEIPDLLGLRSVPQGKSSLPCALGSQRSASPCSSVA